MTRTLPLPTRTEAPPLPSYRDALAALVDPAPEPLLREAAPTRARLAELAAEHLHHVRYLHERYLLAETAGNVDGAERALCALTEAGTRYRARKAALLAAHPSPPSLLQQLLAAVYGTGGSNGAASAGVHRSPAGLAAVDLVATIRRQLCARDADLDTTLRAWRPADETAAAAQLDTWAGQIRTLLDPPRSLEGVTPCPACGERYVDVLDGDEVIRKAAIRIVIHRNGRPTDDYAECLATKCRARWERAKWNLLAAAMQTTDQAG